MLCLYSNPVSRPRLVIFSVLVLAANLLLLPSRSDGSDIPAQDRIFSVLQQRCVKCHGGTGPDGRLGEPEAGVDFHRLTPAELSADLDLLQQLIEVLDLSQMPPEEEAPLEPALRHALVDDLTQVLHAAVTLEHQYAPSPMRRMNRFQFNNAVEDLFQLNCIVFTLPEKMLREYNQYFQPASGMMPDSVRVGSRPLGKSQMIEPRLSGVAVFPQDLRAENGFDNRADHLTLSPLLLESMMRVSLSIVDSPDFGPKTCGIWNSFFEAPETALASAELRTEIQSRLRPFLTRAFRRPVEESVLNRYVNHAVSRLDAGESFTETMKGVAAAAIASPQFFYLFDRGSLKADEESLDGFSIASRLSFFLWGSIPDPILLDAAAAGLLSDPRELSLQVERMLQDRKLKRFCDSFPSQWLQLDRIVSSAPNPARFPEFYFAKYNSSMHMMLEPLLLFETVLIENRSILQFIDSDFAYRSDRLQNLFYGAPPQGKGGETTTIPFQRVPISDRRQGGVITNAAVMTMTSGPERTKPITRGAWLATVIFNNPPEPPPANVPPLDEVVPEQEAGLTLRERLVAHRQRADCSGCHEKIDPLGFALENYGPTGKWRDVDENGLAVDARGKLFNQHEFSDVVQFKDAILKEKDRFTRAFASHMLSFALAREVHAADSLAVEQIARQTAADGYRLQTLIRSIVLSEPFQKSSRTE